MPDSLFSTFSQSKQTSLAQSKRIIGLQANQWTEYINTDEHLDFLTFPRLTAMADAAWSAKSNKSYDEFLIRLKKMYTFYQAKGIYAFNVFNPAKTPETITKKLKRNWINVYELESTD